MSYIGKSPAVGNFVKLDAISTSSTNSYSLTLDSVAFVPESANHMLVSLNGVIQAPLTAFSVSGSTITFLPSSGTLSSSDSIDFIMVYGNVLDIGTPSDSTVTNAKTNFVSTSSSAGLQIKGDNTTAGTLQLNCEQNSHGVKLRSPAHSSGQSYTLTLPTGNVTADKFLKVASVSGSGTTGVGQLSFADAGGGCWEKLDTITISGTTSQIEHEEANFTSTHRDYKIMLSGILVSADSLMLMRIAGDGASLETSNNYRYANTSYKSNNAVNNTYDHGTNRFVLGGTNTGTSSALYTTSFEINIYNPLSTTSYKSFSSFGFHNDDNDYAMTHVGAGIYVSAQATAMKRWVLFMNSGDFTGGTSTLYGRAV